MEQISKEYAGQKAKRRNRGSSMDNIEILRRESLKKRTCLICGEPLVWDDATFTQYACLNPKCGVQGSITTDFSISIPPRIEINGANNTMESLAMIQERPSGNVEVKINFQDIPEETKKGIENNILNQLANQLKIF